MNLENIEAERSVIGCLLTLPSQAMQVCIVYKVEAKWFSYPRNIIFEVIESLASLHKELTLAMIYTSLNYDAAMIAECETAMNRAAAISHISIDIQLIMQSHGYRNLNKLLDEAKTNMDLAQPFAEYLAEQLGKLAALNIHTATIQTTADMKVDLDKRMDKANEQGYWGIPSRWQDLTNIIAGYEPRKMFIAAGRPGEGKTSWGLNEAKHKARHVGPVDIYSYEMEAQELWAKMTADEAGIDLQLFKQGRATTEDRKLFDLGWKTVTALPIHIDNTHYKAEGLVATMRNNHARHGTVWSMVDYVQLIQARKHFAQRNSEIGYISTLINDVAAETNAVMLLSQLNRMATRERPTISHLRDSGCLEADAYLVALLYTDPGYRGNLTDNVPTFIDICKHRGGSIGTAKFIFEKSKQRFARVL